MAALAESDALSVMPPEPRAELDLRWDEWDLRYAASLFGAATLVHQHSGNCNTHVTDDGPVLFDRSDVVGGHPDLSCDRFLDQTPSSARERVIAAFCKSARLQRPEFDAMRRSNVLHEVLRAHDELARTSTRRTKLTSRSPHPFTAS